MYYLVLLLGTILQMFKDRKRVYFSIFVVVLSILAFLRYGIGPDYFSYQYLYERLNVSVLHELKNGLDNQELGFRLIGSFLKKTGFTYQMYLVLFAGINLIYVAKICKKYSKNPTMSMLLYFCFYYFVWTYSGLRQGITISVGVYYLLEYMGNKNLFKLTFIVILLSLVHTSAIIIFPLTYLALHLNLNRKMLIILSLLGMMISFIPIGSIISKLTFIPFISRLYPYLNTDYSIMNILDFQSLGRIVFLFIALLYYDTFCKQGDISKKIIDIYILSLILYFLFKFSELTAARLSIYGKILDMIILPNIYYLYKDKFNKLIFMTGLCILSILYLNKELKAMQYQSGVVDSNTLLIPYINIYNKDNYSFDNIYKDALSH
jgi:hypothetical protein